MNRFVVAALAAAAASGGDLLMLYVVGAERPDLGLPLAGSWMLPLAYYLGVLGIPLYAVGYAALAVTLARDAPRASRTILIVGTILGVLGAVLHGVTGVAVEAQLRAGAGFPDPVEGLLVFGEYILPLWAAVGLLGLLASGAYVYAVARGRSPLPRWAAAVNPVLLILVMVIASSGSMRLEAFLAPAAPNLAHALFFAFLATYPHRHE
jgi:hypothetical protein